MFIDETAATTKMVRLRGRCPRGKRLVGHAPHGHWKIITFVAGLRNDGMVAPFVVDGPMDGSTFVSQGGGRVLAALSGHTYLPDRPGGLGGWG